VNSALSLLPFNQYSPKFRSKPLALPLLLPLKISESSTSKLRKEIQKLQSQANPAKVETKSASD
jgi:hypothetical protein